MLVNIDDQGTFLNLRKERTTLAVPTKFFQILKYLIEEALAKLSEVRAPIRIRTASDSVLIPGKRGFARGSEVSRPPNDLTGFVRIL